MQRLYFSRHGSSAFNEASKWSGSSDAPLTKTGKAQALQAGEFIKKNNLKINLIVSSPLERAHHTAEIIAEQIGLPKKDIMVNKLFTERDFGVLEGRKDLVATTKYLVSEAAIDDYEGVEKLADLQKRAEKALKFLQAIKEDNVLLVSHGAFGKALRRAIKNHHISVRGKSFAHCVVEELI